MNIPTEEEFLEAVHNASNEQLKAIIHRWVSAQELSVFAMSDAMEIVQKRDTMIKTDAEIREAIKAAANCWFTDTFDNAMLDAMVKHGIITQRAGFTAACVATMQAEMEAALGVEDGSNPRC